MTTTTPRSRESIDLLALKKEAQGQNSTEPGIVPREQEFDVRYHAPDGETHASTLISEIKSGDGRVLVGQLAAQMARGAIWVSLPPATQARVWALANITIQLQEPPEWVLRWCQEDDSLLYGVSRVLEVHESDYFRGHGESGEALEESSRLEIITRPAATSPGLPVPSHHTASFGS